MCRETQVVCTSHGSAKCRGTLKYLHIFWSYFFTHKFTLSPPTLQQLAVMGAFEPQQFWCPSTWRPGCQRADGSGWLAFNFVSRWQAGHSARLWTFEVSPEALRCNTSNLRCHGERVARFRRHQCAGSLGCFQHCFQGGRVAPLAWASGRRHFTGAPRCKACSL